MSVGCTFTNLEKHEQALECKQRALRMRQMLFEGNHPDVAQAMSSVGAAYGNMGKHE